MARCEDSNPPIKILILGAHGVGKSCLESRFTTGRWPPSYDPSLTLCSRRFYTFQPSYVPLKGTIQPSTTSNAETSSSGHDATTTSAAETNRPQPCAACLTKSRTHLIEIINYPLLHHAATRRKVLSAGQYDAVVLVYDVGSRTSFEHLKTLYAEVDSLLAHQRLRRVSATRRKTRHKWWTLFSMFGGAPGDGDEENVGRREGARTTVVAVVGNKCDLDDDDDDNDDATLSCDDGDGGYDERLEFVNYAPTLFGRQSLHHAAVDQAGSLAQSTSTSTPSPACHDRPVLIRSNQSADTIDGFFQVGGNGSPAEIVTAGEEVSEGSNTSGSRTMVDSRMQRQVSTVEGEALAKAFATQVPFFEASAKTGKNVEEMFEAVAKAVLHEMGRADAGLVELAKRCHHQDRAGEGKDEDTRWGFRDLGLGLDLPVSGVLPGSSEVKKSSLVRPVEVKAMGRKNMGTILEQPLKSKSMNNQHPRREIVVERARKMFIEESPVGGGLAL